MISRVNLADTSLIERAKAARALIRNGRIEGDIALSYVIWPDISPADTRRPFRLLAAVIEPERCHAVTRAATFPGRCPHPVIDDKLCGRHLRCLREGRPLIYFWEES
jgi:hypothetical protein